MKKYLGDSVKRLTRRQMVGGVAISGLAVLLAACGGGGGGDSSSADIDLDAAYERIVDCMGYDDIVKAVGAKPNYYDSGNTLRWNYGDMWLRVTTIHDRVNDKELLRGLQRVKRYGFPINCS